MTMEVLSAHRRVWRKKLVLRTIYADYYRRIVEKCIPGRSLEIGGGSGNLKEHLSDVISTDIVPTPWLDVAADAQALPFSDGFFSNIIVVDVLHHIERPQRFFEEAERVLATGGRIVMIEPAITPISRLSYLFTPEPVDMKADPFAEGELDPDRLPFDANQAIPTLIFDRKRAQLKRLFPSLKVKDVKNIGLFTYPLSGVFRPWCLIPSFLIHSLLRIENSLESLLGKWMAYRLFVVMEKGGNA